VKDGRAPLKKFSSSTPLFVDISKMFSQPSTPRQVQFDEPMSIARRIYTSNWTTLLMTPVTIFALYGQDMKLVCLRIHTFRMFAF
jgi:hypothetical protein